MHVLDNPVWHALTGPQATVAEGDALALRYDPEVSVFAAVADEPARASWDALGALVGAGGSAVVVRDVVGVPPGWTERFRAPARRWCATTRPSTCPPTTGARSNASDRPTSPR